MLSLFLQDTTSDHLFALALAMVGLSIYFLPAIIGAARHKRNSMGIFILNFLLGWTILGWIGALIWAVAYEKPAAVPIE